MNHILDIQIKDAAPHIEQDVLAALSDFSTSPIVERSGKVPFILTNNRLISIAICESDRTAVFLFRDNVHSYWVQS